MLIDLHNHTSRYSSCSVITPDDLVDRYIQKKIDGLCITEHQFLWPEQYRKELTQKYQGQIRLFFGMEADTDAGHFLLFGETLPDNLKAGEPVKSLLKKIDREITAVIWAHPLRWPGQYPVERYINEDFLKRIDAVELYNGNINRALIDQTAKLFSRFNMKMTGGSDTHSLEMSCRYATRFDSPVNDIQDLVRVIKTGKYQPEIIENFIT